MGRFSLFYSWADFFFSFDGLGLLMLLFHFVGPFLYPV